MKDVIIEKKKDKAIARFEDLFHARKEIYANGSTESLKNNYVTNELAEILHPENIEVKIEKIIIENENTKSFYLKPVKEILPPFKACSSVTLEINIDDRIYKKPFYITSSITNQDNYRLTIYQEEMDLVSNYIYQNAQEGQEFKISGPLENFSYNAIRDSKDVIFICSMYGIIPIYSMINELLQRKVSSVTLLYEVKKKEDLLWEKELQELVEKNKNFKVLYFLKEESQEGFIDGEIKEEHVKNLQPMGKSFFVSGPIDFYESLNNIFKKLDIPNKFIRHNFYVNRLTNLIRTEHKLTLKTKEKSLEIPCYENETLLESIEKAQIEIPSHCTVGICGLCRSKLVNGEVKTEISGLRKKDIELKYIHPCVSYPISDITLELPF